MFESVALLRVGCGSCQIIFGIFLNFCAIWNCNKSAREPSSVNVTTPYRKKFVLEFKFCYFAIGKFTKFDMKLNSVYIFILQGIIFMVQSKCFAIHSNPSRLMYFKDDPARCLYKILCNTSFTPLIQSAIIVMFQPVSIIQGNFAVQQWCLFK